MYSYPFESQNTGTDAAPIYDRAITAEMERQFNKLRYTNGVFNTPATSLQVTAKGGMQVTVSPGGCHIEGALAYEASDRTITVDPASSAGNRIDRVICRFSTSLSDRNIEIEIISGTVATTPLVPEITTEPNYYEIVLADIYVAKNAAEITNADITDQRANSELCGFVVPAIPTPLNLDALYQQYQASLDQYLDLVASALDETTAGNLQGQLTAVKTTADNNANALANLITPETIAAAKAAGIDLTSGGGY